MRYYSSNVLKSYLDRPSRTRYYSLPNNDPWSRTTTTTGGIARTRQPCHVMYSKAQNPLLNESGLAKKPPTRSITLKPSRPPRSSPDVRWTACVRAESSRVVVAPVNNNEQLYLSSRPPSRLPLLILASCRRRRAQLAACNQGKSCRPENSRPVHGPAQPSPRPPVGAQTQRRAMQARDMRAEEKSCS